MPPGAPISRQGETSGKVWRATGLETPVFFDERGHRAKLVRFGGACTLALVATWLALVVSGPLGFAKLPDRNFLLPQLHHQHSTALAHQLVHQRAPRESAD
jgi:hypothetical protein